MADVAQDILRQQGLAGAAAAEKATLLDTLQEHWVLLVIAVVVLLHVAGLAWFLLALARQTPNRSAMRKRIDMFGGGMPVKED